MELTNTHLTRQMDIIPMDVLGLEINIIGAGAIGSFTALALAKMGFSNLTVYDFDEIEIENMNCQFYRYEDIGKKKVDALKEIVKSFANVDITAIPERYDGEKHLGGVIISAVDSMAARQTIWDAHKLQSFTTQLLIDPRMSAEIAMCYAMKPLKAADVESYENTLYSDENAVRERCTAKATMYTVLLISGHVAAVVKDFACGNSYARNVQWSTKEYDLLVYKNKEVNNEQEV